MANFFIDRPIFARVLAILLCLTGALAIFSLPVEQYPDLAPPNVRITANYPGASAQTLENTVTRVIEQNMTGLDNLMYMSSQSSGTGQATITLSFIAGTDPDEAVQQVQNQLQSAMRKLPQAVQDQGVTVRKTGDTNILTIAFVSTDGSMDKQDIADYVASNIQDPLSRVNGVGDIDAYGSQYSMRIWLDHPAKLNSFQMTTKDVTDAIESQNAQIAVGQLGGTPSVDKQALNATINAQSLLQTPQQFRDITLRVNQDGSEVKLGDVATVELGRKSMTTSAVLTAIRLPVLALSWPPARTKWRPRSWYWIASTSWRSTSLTARNTRSRMKPPPLSKPRLSMWSKRCWKLSRWFSGDVSVPAKLSRHAHSDDRRAGSINGHLLRALRVWLQY